MSANNLFTMNSTPPASSSSVLGSVDSGLSSLATTLNSLSGLALPLEKDVGGFSQLYTQVKQLNPQAQTAIPVNEAFYQAPNNSLTGNFANGIGAAFNQIPNYMWWVIGGVVVVGTAYVLTRKKYRG